MKLNRIITLCAMAAMLATSATSLLAQDNAGDQGGQGNQGNQGNRGNQGNQGGQRRNRGQGGQNGGNFDPEQFRQQMEERMLETYADELSFTNDTEWEAVKPLVKKVMDAQMENMGGRFGGMGRMFRNRGGGDLGGGGGNTRQRGGFGSMFQQSPETEALQKAIDDNAPSSQIKDLLAKYKAAQKAKQAKLEAAQDDLRKVLTTKQEAQATLIGLLN